MKILVLGAGATGGYFGGRLIQAGADVTFLVRERRAAQLAAHGLTVKSPHGDFAVPVKTLQQDDARPEYDVVLLTCKAYDLDAAIASIRPAMAEHSHCLPLLNGLAHLDQLAREFGAARVLGGTCQIAGTMSATGEIQQLTTLHRIAYGLLPGTAPTARTKLEALHEHFRRTPVDTVLADDILLELWEKFTLLATLAAMTSLMRGTVGDILRTDEGEGLMIETLEACARAAAAGGHPVRDKAMVVARKMLLDRGSTFAASMLRDIENGNRVEADHIVGDMLQRIRSAGGDRAPLRAAYCHLQTYQARQRRERGEK
jgi:2-dehydropantoate 2-reductase